MRETLLTSKYRIQLNGNVYVINLKRSRRLVDYTYNRIDEMGVSIHSEVY